jgi:hypothetical protein
MNRLKMCLKISIFSSANAKATVWENRCVRFQADFSAKIICRLRHNFTVPAQIDAK